MRMAEQWASDRLRAAGGPGELRFVIKRASVVETELPRTTGIQLAVLTLALSQLALLFVSYSDFLGRDDGLSGLTRPRLDFWAFSVDLTTPARYYTFMLIVCAAATVILCVVCAEV